MNRDTSRYRDTGIEGEWQPGFRKRVLRNLKGVQLKTDMDRLETDALVAAEELGVRPEWHFLKGFYLLPQNPVGFNITCLR